jgi:hypothetical protein
MKEASVDSSLRRRPLTTWEFVSKITDEVILGLDGLSAHDASVDVGRHMQGMAEEEIILCTPRRDQDLRPIRRIAANFYLFGVGDS